MKTRTYADICARQGQFDEAIAIYRALLERTPTDEILRRRLADLEALQSGALAPPKSPQLRALEALLHRVQSRRHR